MRVCTRTSDERICGPGWVGLLTRDVSDTVLYSEPGGWKLLCTRGHSSGPGGGASAEPRARPRRTFSHFGFIGRHNTDDLIISMVHASREHPCARIWNKGLTCGYGHGRDGQAAWRGHPEGENGDTPARPSRVHSPNAAHGAMATERTSRGRCLDGSTRNMVSL